MSDVNKAWLTGVAASDPVFTKLGQKTPLTYFTLRVTEEFKDRTGNAHSRPNDIRVESLGKMAEATYKKVKQGKRYTVDGYLRCDEVEGRGMVRIRTFAVYSDSTAENTTYQAALTQAIRVIKTSRDKESALERLEEMIL
jgi:single-stranded DNA-binding protein